MTLISLAQVDLHSLEALDYPGDDGTKVIVRWTKIQSKGTYEVQILSKEDGSIVSNAKLTEQNLSEYSEDLLPFPFWIYSKGPDNIAVPMDIPKWGLYTAKVIFVSDSKVESNSVDAAAFRNIFNTQKLNNLLIALMFLIAIIYFTSVAKRKDLHIRKLPGLDAIEEAIGRATEMGKPVLYQTGTIEIGDTPLSSISLAASFSVLSEVAYKTAGYETDLLVPHKSPLNMVICQEVTREAYTRAGKPHLYKENSNFFISYDQFAYVSTLEGIYMREKPATCIYMGYFYAESLMLAETASSVGAIQIAGTDALNQLPFFFAACDYTLIGEELYAAGAYLSKEPSLVAGIKTQDFFRVIFIGAIVVMTLTVTLNNPIGQLLLDFVKPY